MNVKRDDMDNLDEKYRSKNPFTVPDGYFESLGDRVIERVKEAGKPKRTSTLQILKPYLGLAGVFVFAMVIVQLLLPRLIDENRMLAKKVQKAPEVQEEEESIFDTDFDPSREEIIEYLSQESDVTDFLYAERR